MVSEVCIERQEWRGFQRYELKGRSGEGFKGMN